MDLKTILNYRVLTVFIISLFFYTEGNSQYVCVPCNLACDTLSFEQPGSCHVCNMKLIQGSQKVSSQIEIKEGSGNFLINDSRDSSKKIRVFYYKPQSFSKDSKILMVIPGAGRNGDDYRDSWIEASEKYNVLILSPSFNELYYSFEDYHLGGITGPSNLMQYVSRVENTNKVMLDEDNLEFPIIQDSEKWLFGEFDRIFDLAVATLGSHQTTYDLFGHSAGGHVLHRMGLFYHSDKVNRILASNASFYTLPTTKYSYPFGINETNLTQKKLSTSFKNKLVVFLGEMDNADETGGTFLLSESADKQGSHRFERGKFFFEKAKQTANDLGCPFNWSIEVIPGVGHNYSKMGLAASEFLYAPR